MNRAVIAALAPALALAACNQPAGGADAAANTAAPVEAVKPKPIWFRTPDGVTVHAVLYKAEKPKATILLFHQAESSKEEYATIAPKLAAAGYNAVAIDARSGGDMFGKNETVAALGKSADYLDVVTDMQAAISWAKPAGLPVILWGSSYSAALVFSLAPSNKDTVKAMLAFSPGEYFADKRSVGRAAEADTVPTFITSSPDPKEVAEAKAIGAKIPGGNATVYVPADGVHGSSTLIAAKNPKGADANWQAVMAFLAKAAP